MDCIEVLKRLEITGILIINFLNNMRKLDNVLQNKLIIFDKIEQLNNYWKKFQDLQCQLKKTDPQVKTDSIFQSFKYIQSNFEKEVPLSYENALKTLNDMISRIDANDDLSNNQSSKIHDDNKSVLSQEENINVQSQEENKNFQSPEENKNVQSQEENINVQSQEENKNVQSQEENINVQSQDEIVSIISGENSKTKNKRKSIHTSLLTDDDISFEPYDICNNDNIDINMLKATDSLEKLNMLELPDEINTMLKQVAFLRSCINYLMGSCGLQEFNFQSGVSAWLMSAYEQEKEKVFGKKSEQTE